VLVIDPGRPFPIGGRVTAQEAEDYCRTHRDEFKRSHAAFVSYIALPRLRMPGYGRARRRILTLREEIVKGALRRSGSARVRRHRVGQQRRRAGRMSRTSVDPAFAAARESLPSRRCQSRSDGFGFHLIQVDSRKGDTFTASHILVPIEVTGSHRDWLDGRADSLEQLAAERLEPSALDTAASALKLRIGNMGPIREGSRVTVPEGGQVPDVSVWAFQAEEGEESPVIEGEKAFLVFRLDSVQAEGVPPLAAIGRS
jgi:hypothetical protein